VATNLASFCIGFSKRALLKRLSASPHAGTPRGLALKRQPAAINCYAAPHGHSILKIPACPANRYKLSPTSQLTCLDSQCIHRHGVGYVKECVSVHLHIRKLDADQEAFERILGEPALPPSPSLSVARLGPNFILSISVDNIRILPRCLLFFIGILQTRTEHVGAKTASVTFNS